MRAVVQRVSRAKVTVEGRLTGEIGRGLLILLGVTHSDVKDDADYLVDKVVNLRIFEDADGKMNLSLAEIDGELLVVSQFTLYGDTRRGRRPSFIKAASGVEASAATSCASLTRIMPTTSSRAALPANSMIGERSKKPVQRTRSKSR